MTLERFKDLASLFDEGGDPRWCWCTYFRFRGRDWSNSTAKGNRAELAAVEKDQLQRLEAYLPAAVDPEEIRAAVKAAITGGAKNVGAVMGAVMPQFKGRAEGGVINTIVREELAKAG